MAIGSFTAAQPVAFINAPLKAAVEAKLGVSDPNATDMLGLLSLTANHLAISDLTGLETAHNLEVLKLDDNLIRNLSALSGLTHLQSLSLKENEISNLLAFSGLTNLQLLALDDNRISDISSLSGLTNLLSLSLWDNALNYDTYHKYIPALKAKGTSVLYDPEPVWPPQVNTNTAALITATSASLRGYLVYNGGEDCQGRFKYWIQDHSTETEQTTLWQAIPASGNFGASVVHLIPGKVYIFVAEAKNSAGMDSDEEIPFTTLPQTNFEPTILYVDDDAPINGDGLSWATAFKYLQDALAVAQDGDIVSVAQGIYRPDRDSANPDGTGDREATFTLSDGITLKGGYPGHKYAGLGGNDPNAQDPNLYETVLSGDLAGDDEFVEDPCDLKHEPTRLENSTNIVSIKSSSGIRLEGLTISGGFGNITGRDLVASTALGAGIYATNCTELSIQECSFISNYAGWHGGGSYFSNCTNAMVTKCTFAENSGGSGGGLGLSQSSMNLTKCDINNNYAGTSGGMESEYSNLIVTECSFKSNTAEYGYGGASLLGGIVAWDHCKIEGNTAKSGSGGGVGSSLGTHKFINSTFFSNKAFHSGGAIVLGSNNVDIYNCLIAGNSAQEGGAIAAALFEQLNIANCTAIENKGLMGSFLMCETTGLINLGVASITNSIINDLGNILIYTEDATVSINYTNLLGGKTSFIDPNNNVTWGTGNIDIYPLFVDPGYWDDSGTPDDPHDDVFMPGDYHLKSQAGRWDPNSATWVMDYHTSPCIDAGDPNTPVGQEPLPNGNRINMGAYGGTAEASLSYPN